MNDNLRPQCPRCGSMDVHRSRPHSVVDFIVAFLLPVGFRRCHLCMTRRWHFDGSLTPFVSAAIRWAIIGVGAILVLHYLVGSAAAQ